MADKQVFGVPIAIASASDASGHDLVPDVITTVVNTLELVADQVISHNHAVLTVSGPSAKVSGAFRAAPTVYQP